MCSRAPVGCTTVGGPHLAALSDRLRHAAPRFPDLAGSFRKEIDRLLDHRLWLRWKTTTVPHTGGAA